MWALALHIQPLNIFQSLLRPGVVYDLQTER